MADIPPNIPPASGR